MLDRRAYLVAGILGLACGVLGTVSQNWEIAVGGYVLGTWLLLQTASDLSPALRRFSQVGTKLSYLQAGLVALVLIALGTIIGGFYAGWLETLSFTAVPLVIFVAWVVLSYTKYRRASREIEASGER